jgi:uncharacterized protein (DUF1015 family)
MARITPFRAWRYASERVDLSRVVTQPYDKITPAMQDAYYAASPYNLVQIILGRPQPNDDERQNVYNRAAESFHKWRQTGILRQDPAPAFYAYSQAFLVPGTQKKVERLGFIGLGRLEPYASGVIYRHEQTLSKPKADRFKLLRATRGHFGQIFMLYSGSDEIDRSLRSDKTPDIEVSDEYGVLHRVWCIDDSTIIDSLQTQMRDKKLIIADGHHRYETALAYRDERRAVAETGEHVLAAISQTPTYESVMMTFVNMNSPGLVILPTHRVIFGLHSFSDEQLHSQAKRYFNVEEVDSGIDAARATGILRGAGVAGPAIVAVTANRAFLMHSPKAIGSNLFSGLSLQQQSLDVVQLHKCLLEGVLHLTEEAIRNQQSISYYRDAAEALARVRSGQADVAFLMNPVRMQQVRDIAFAGEVLPQKSTDFYPKLLSGFTIYALD